jgi:diketogulonate reductase-like aldo/keto reductase
LKKKTKKLLICWAKSAFNCLNKYNKSIAQFILRWNLQNGVVTIPKSTKEHRIAENSAVFDFELSKEDMERIDRLNQDHRVRPDPDNFDF